MPVLRSTDDLYVVEIATGGSPRSWCVARGPAIELLWQQLPQRYWIRDGAAVRFDRPVGSLQSGHVGQVPDELVILAV